VTSVNREWISLFKNPFIVELHANHHVRHIATMPPQLPNGPSKPAVVTHGATSRSATIAITAMTKRDRRPEQTRYLRRALDALAATLGGSAAAPTTSPEAAVLNNALQYAVEIEALPANNPGRVGWRPQISHRFRQAPASSGIRLRSRSLKMTSAKALQAPKSKA
jgi:hypothetical protein